MILSKIQANIDDFYVKDYYSNGTIINIEQAYNTNISNISIEDSIFDGILESQCDINISNLKIKNSISQSGYANKKSLPAFNIKMNSITISDSDINGFSCKSTVFNVQSYGQLIINNTSFKDLYAKETIITHSYTDAKTEDPSPLIIDHCTFNGVSSSSSMFSLETGAGCTITSSTFENIGFCPTETTTNCENADKGSFVSLIDKATLNIMDSKIINSKANKGGAFFINHESLLRMESVTISNSLATDQGGVFLFENYKGDAYIDDCYFNECQAKKGGVFAISGSTQSKREDNLETTFRIKFENSKFTKNIAEYGGVYFIDNDINNINLSESLTIGHCILQDNSAIVGGIGFSFNENIAPSLVDNESVNNTANYYGDEFGYQPKCQCINGYCDSGDIKCVDENKFTATTITTTTTATDFATNISNDITTSTTTTATDFATNISNDITTSTTTSLETNTNITAIDDSHLHDSGGVTIDYSKYFVLYLYVLLLLVYIF